VGNPGEDRTLLFEPWTRHDPSQAGDEESTWAFLDRVDDRAIERIRRLMNAWFAAYPAEHRKGLKGRLASGDDVEFHGAWFELYLHALHRGLGFTVDVEPTLPEATTHPDFLLAWDDNRVLLEATIIGHRKQTARTRRIERVIAAVNRTQSADFKLFFEIDAEGNDAPPMREVRRRLERWLADLDWAETRALQERAFSFETMDRRIERVGDWQFSFRAWPREPEKRGVPGPAIAAGPSDGATFDHAGTLLGRLSEKAGKYRVSGDPVIIAVRLDRIGADTEDIAAALFGPTIGRADPGKTTTIPTGRRGTGFFRHEDGRWRHRHVVGILVWDIDLRPWSIARQQPVFWRHPHPLQAAPSLPWHFAYLDASANPKVTVGAFDPTRAFDLPDASDFDERADWPGAFRFGGRE
jgi:hypothetical protein